MPPLSPPLVIGLMLGGFVLLGGLYTCLLLTIVHMARRLYVFVWELKGNTNKRGMLTCALPWILLDGGKGRFDDYSRARDAFGGRRHDGRISLRRIKYNHDMVLDPSSGAIRPRPGAPSNWDTLKNLLGH